MSGESCCWTPCPTRTLGFSRGPREGNLLRSVLLASQKGCKGLSSLLHVPAHTYQFLLGLYLVPFASLAEQVEQLALPLDVATDLESQVGQLSDSGSHCFYTAAAKSRSVSARCGGLLRCRHPALGERRQIIDRGDLAKTLSRRWQPVRPPFRSRCDASSPEPPEPNP